MQYWLWISSSKAYICFCKHDIKSWLLILFQIWQEDRSLCGWCCIILQNLPPCWVTFISSSIIPSCIYLISLNAHKYYILTLKRSQISDTCFVGIFYVCMHIPDLHVWYWGYGCACIYVTNEGVLSRYQGILA